MIPITYHVLVAGTGVIDQNVEMSPKLDGFIDSALPIRCFSDVHTLKLEGFGRRSYFLACYFVDVADEDLSALFSEVLSDTLAKSRRGASFYLSSGRRCDEGYIPVTIATLPSKRPMITV